MERVVVGRDGTEQVGHRAVGAARICKELFAVEGSVCRKRLMVVKLVCLLDGVAEGERRVAP